MVDSNASFSNSPTVFRAGHFRFLRGSAGSEKLFYGLSALKILGISPQDANTTSTCVVIGPASNCVKQNIFSFTISGKNAEKILLNKLIKKNNFTKEVLLGYFLKNPNTLKKAT